MRITVSCPDVQAYLNAPKTFLPAKPVCPNDPSHSVHYHANWQRQFCPDHVNIVAITLFNAYCKKCRETISFWPEFVLPYQAEPLEIHESAVVEYLAGETLKDIAEIIGYDQRSTARWVKRILEQSRVLFDDILARVLPSVPQEPLSLHLPSSARETTHLLMSWLRRFAANVSFERLNRLIGLGNFLGRGNWDLWGAPLGNAKSRVKSSAPPG